MSIYKKVLFTLICIFMIIVMFLFGGCHEKTALDDEMGIEFPVNQEGYPQMDTVIINGKPYPVKIVGHSHIANKVDYEIEIKMEKKSDIVEILLPQCIPINNWSIEEKEYINLISYSRTDFPIKDGYMNEGMSVTVQRFKLQVAMDETTKILLKWSNVNEADKLFKDKKEDYLLKIMVSY